MRPSTYDGVQRHSIRSSVSKATPSITALLLKLSLSLGLLVSGTDAFVSAASLSSVPPAGRATTSTGSIIRTRGGDSTGKRNVGPLFFQKRVGGAVDVQDPPVLDVQESLDKQEEEQRRAPTFIRAVSERLTRFNPASSDRSDAMAAIETAMPVAESRQRTEDRSLPTTEPEDSEPLTLTSAIALVAGTTVGAGILALPAFTIKAGFLPSSLCLSAAWVYMVTTGLLIAEVNLNVAGKSHQPDGGLVSMARRTIGDTGANLTGAAYMFLHYALLVAYIAQGGDILTGALEGAGAALGFGGGDAVVLPAQVAPVLFTAVLGGALAFGNKKWLDSANDALVGVVVVAFLALVAAAGPRADPGGLMRANWTAMLPSIPVMFVALVYHNIVPVISYRLRGDADKIRTSIVVGSGIPLLMFLAWNAVILGNIDASILTATSASGGTIDPLAVLRAGGAGHTLGNLISLFSEVAIVTSFTGFVYGLKDFFKDVLFSGALARSGTRHLSHNQDMLAYSLILFPPLAVALVNPDIFFSALDNAGAFGICVLFGIIPAVMAAIVRHRSQEATGGGVEGGGEGEEYLRLVPGGNVVLGGIGVVAAFVIIQKAVELIG